VTESRIGQRRAAAKSEGSEAYRRRRQEVIQAGAKVFKEMGYGRANLADVAAELGADRASMYYYFKSKQELFHEVVREAVEANVRLVEELRKASGTPAEKLERVIEALMQSYADHYPYLYVYIQEDMNKVTGGDSAWETQTRALNRRFTDALVSIVEDGQKDGSLKRLASPEILTYGLIGMVNWSHRWFDPSRSMPADGVGQAYAAMVLDGLRSV
jgi:AcrR family transcriptional regulator